MRKLVALGGCAALVAAGYACGSWHSARNQRVNREDFLNKATDAEQFGKAFSAATAGKSWSEIQTITANTKAGVGTLGDSYAALSSAAKTSFHLSASKSVDSGTTSAGHTTEVAAQKSSPATAVSASPAVSAEEAKALAAAVTADNKDTATKAYCADLAPAQDGHTENDGWYMSAAQKGKQCAAKPCVFTSSNGQGKDAATCLTAKPLCSKMSGGSATTACAVTTGDKDKYKLEFTTTKTTKCVKGTCASGSPTAEDQAACCQAGVLCSHIFTGHATTHCPAADGFHDAYDATVALKAHLPVSANAFANWDALAASTAKKAAQNRCCKGGNDLATGLR